MPGSCLSVWDLLPDSLVLAAVALVCYASTQFPSVPGGDSGELIAAACSVDGYGIPHPPGYPLHTMLARLMISALPVGTIAARVTFLSGICSALAAAAIYCAGRILASSALGPSRPGMLPPSGPCSADQSSAAGRDIKQRASPGDRHTHHQGSGGGHREEKTASGEEASASGDGVDAACARWGSVFAAGVYSLSPLVWTYSTQAEVFPLNNLLSRLYMLSPLVDAEVFALNNLLVALLVLLTAVIT
ncbi:hypothetical protein T484DRAFT_1897303, partial [Baffinella frigidus]